jgi:hypothetical protein
MAKIYGHNDAVDFAAKNLITFNGSFARGAGQPLDKTAVWYPKDGVSGYDRAVAYAATEAAYVGQELAVIDVAYAEDGTTVVGTTVKFYGIQDAAGTLKELGAVPVGDESTITVDEDGKISLKGVDTLTFERDVVGDDGEPTGSKEEIKYQILLTKNGLTWVEPSKTTVEGLASLISALESKTTQLESKVGTNTSAIAAEVTAREAADEALTEAITDLAKNISDAIGEVEGDTTVVGMIGAALEAAKKYADDNDSDTIYDDTAVKARIKAIEDDYLKTADKYDDTKVKADIAGHETRLGAIETAIGDESKGLTKALNDEIAARAQGDADTLAAAKAYTDNISVAIETKENVEYIVIKNVDGTEIAAVDATKFVKDGMLDSADYSTETKKLVLTWNTDAGKSATEIDLNDLVNTYIGSDHIIVGTDGKISITDDVALESDLTALETAFEKAIEDEAKARDDADKAIGERIDGVVADVALKAVKTDVETALAAKADKSAFDTHVEAYGEFVEGYTADKETFATKTDLENKVDTTTYTNDMAKVAKTETVNSQFTSVGQRIDLVEENLGKNAAAVTETLKDYAKTSDVETALEDYYTKSEVYTKSETDLKIDAKIASVTGGESAADVKSALESYRDALNQEVWGADAANWTTTTTEDGKTKVVYEPNYSKVSRIDTLENKVGQLESADEAHTKSINDHSSRIGTLETGVNGLQDGLSTVSGAYTTLDNKVTNEIAPKVAALDTAINGEAGLASTVAGHSTKLSGLETKDAELAGKIQANTDKFADYYTKSEEDAAHKDLSDAIKNVDLSSRVAVSDFETYKTAVSTELAKKAVASEVAASFETVNTEVAKKADKDSVYDKTTADATFVKSADFESLVDARVNTLIDGANSADTITNVTNLIEFVNNNAGTVAQLVTDVKANGDALEAQAALIEANDTAIKANASAISSLVTVVETGLAAATVHTSTEIEVAARTGENQSGVELNIKEVNVNKLVQTESDVLILNGGNATA